MSYYSAMIGHSYNIEMNSKSNKYFYYTTLYKLMIYNLQVNILSTGIVILHI